MDSSELTEDELLASTEHGRDLQIDKTSIYQAVKDFEFDKLSREELELEAAENLLELKELRKSRMYLVSKLATLNLHGGKKRKGWIEGLIALDKVKGGDGKSAKYEPLRELARDLVITNNCFKSRRNAAMTIAPKIIAKGKEIGVELSEPQAVDTITGWLRDAGLPANI